MTLQTGANLAKYTKSDLTKNTNFAKNKSFRIDFLIFKDKKSFIHLWKDFTIVQISYFFELEYYIWMKTDAFGFTISEIHS